MDKTLEAKIEERKKQAKDRQIHEKARDIAKYLGQGYETTDERQYTFEGSDLLIMDDFKVVHGSDGSMAGFGTNIYYKGEQVYKDGGGQIYSYIPGRWEETFNKLYSKAEKARKKKEKEEKPRLEKERRKKEKKIKAKWGL